LRHEQQERDGVLEARHHRRGNVPDHVAHAQHAEQRLDDERAGDGAVETGEHGGRDVRVTERPEREHAVPDARGDGDDAAGDTAGDLAA
jgi:hypothetical protein